MVVTIGTILAQWQSIGVFDYLLPFLLIFAVVFGVLRYTNILGNEKSVHTIVALAVAALAVWSGRTYVQEFFLEGFPRLGVGIAVIVMALILVGLFIPKENAKTIYYVLLGVSALIWIIINLGTFDALGWYSSYNIGDYAGTIIGVVLLIVLVVIIAVGNSSGKPNPSEGSADIGATTHRVK